MAGIKRSLFAIMLWCGFLCLGPQSVMANQDPIVIPEQITIYITDFGINQWNDRLRLGADFTWAANHVFPELPSAAQILVPMPPDHEFDRMSATQLTQYITTAVSDKIDAALHDGIVTFEVQFVQNINTRGYVDPGRQRSVNVFGDAAYQAIGKINDRLTSSGIDVYNYAISGSNGTKVLTENVTSWQGYLDGADLYDGRAFWTPTVQAVGALGAQNVRFFNTRGDWPAPYAGVRSIGNFQTVQDLKVKFPAIESYLLDPVERVNVFGRGHVAGMTSASENLLVKEYLGDGRFRASDPWLLTGRDLRPLRIEQWMGSGPVSGSTAASRLITSIETFNKHLGFLESVLDQDLIPSNLGTALDFLPAIIKDSQTAQRGTFHPLTSHVLEQFGSFGLKQLPGVVDDLVAKGMLSQSFRLAPTLFGIDEFVAGGASHLGRGAMGIDEITHYLDGVSKMTAAIAGGLVGGAQGAKIGEAGADLALWSFRGATMPLFQEMANRPVRQNMIRQWQAAQEARLAYGQAALSFSEMFGSSLLQQVGFDSRTVADLDRSVAWANPDATIHSPQDPGGVDTTMDPTRDAKDLGAVAAEVLEARPDEETLGWEIGLEPETTDPPPR